MFVCVNMITIYSSMKYCKPHSSTIATLTQYMIFNLPPSSHLDGDSSTSPRSPSSKRYVTSPTQAESMSYLLAPPNIFSMKVAHREICTETHPKLDVIMDSTLIPFAIQSGQYQQLKLVSQEFKDMDRRRLLITHRPQLRPTSAPREWWFYAYSLITGRNLNNGKGKVSIVNILYFPCLLLLLGFIDMFIYFYWVLLICFYTLIGFYCYSYIILLGFIVTIATITK